MKAAVLCLAVGWALPGFTQTVGHRLLTTSIRTGNTEVFSVDPVTGDAFNITKSPGSEERYPVWSPDGRQVVFTSNRAGSGTSTTFNLFIANADGTGVRRLTDQPEGVVYYFPSWTADAGRIYFNIADDAKGKAKIGYVTPDGKQYVEVADGRDGAISPDGKTIAFTKKVNKGFCVFAMNADGSGVRQLTRHEDEMGAVSPVWSPDGRHILFSDQVGEALELFICDADGSNLRQLTKLGKISSSGAWSPDGSQITFRVTEDAYWRSTDTRDRAYADKRADKRPVWIIGADGSDPHVIEVLRYQCAIDGSRAAWRPVR
ncbi:TolB family protein [Larkinella soli]|uniref:TolB family protein n=1 Tax=Larkinella soli TaxID=1770527 RepID=UPI000FFC6522|nr:PD40 domain-containing protein [Larkinella soli]